MPTSNDGIMVILSSPSGAGKTTLVNLLSKNNNFEISISHTTRKPRPNETSGKDYYFVSDQEFKRLIKNEEFLEYAKVFNNYYGTTRTPVIDSLNKGKNVLFDIDWQGADQIKNKNLDFKLITFFILPPSKEILYERLSNRDMKDKLIAEERMKQFERDVLHWINYNYVVINDDLNSCYNKIQNLITAELSNGSKDYDIEYIRNHVEKLNFLNFHIPLIIYNKFQNLNFEVLNLNQY
jgi:guanylate kinase